MRRGTLAELSEFVSVSKEKYNPASGINYDCIELEHIQKQTGILLGTIPSLEQASIKNRFQAGDTLFGKLRPNLRKFFLPSFAGVCSTEIWVLKADTKRIDKAFLFYLVQSEKFIEAAGKTTGSKMPRADWEILSATPFYLPPLPEQRKIAAILRTWDEGIAVTGKLIAAQQNYINALSILLFQYSDKHGERCAFGEFLSENSIFGTTGESAQKITVKLYGKGVIPKRERNTGSASTRYYVRKAGQLIYSKLDFLNGAFGIIPENLEGYESTQDLPAFDIAPSVNAQWLLEYLIREQFYTSCEGIARGLRKARRINPSDFLQIPLKLPPKEIQDKVADILVCARSNLEKTLYLQNFLQSQKRGLMQKLLTGELVVHSEQEAA